MTDKRNCPVCKTENSGEYEYCKECGAKLPPVIVPTVYTESQNTASADNVQMKYCGSCGTVVGKSDRFCNKCGARLVAEQRTFDSEQNRNSEQDSYNAYGYNTGTYASYEDNRVFDINENDLREFIGTNAESFINRYKKMERNGSKASWNWPVFLFSLLLNVPFVWFFYRKMYKIGSILLAVCVALNILTLSFTANMLTPFMDMFSKMFDSSAGFVEQYYEDYYYDEYSDEYYDEFNEYIENYIQNNQEQIYGLVDDVLMIWMLQVIVTLIYLILSVLLAIFANRMYLNHCIKKIGKIPNTADESSRRFIISQKGGSSIGIAVGLGIGVPVLMFIVNFAVLTTQIASTMF